MLKNELKRDGDSKKRHHASSAMRRVSFGALLAIALLTQAATAQDSSAGQELTLALPHPLATGERAWIEVQLGAISKGRVVNVTTASGLLLGTISPFGARPGQNAGTFTLPLPADAIRDGRVTVRVTISQPGGPPRAPTAQEVRAVTIGAGGGVR